MKKFISVFLSLIIMTSILAGVEITAHAASYTSGSLTLSLDESTGVMTISGNGASADYTSTNAVYSRAWATTATNRNKITSIVVKEGVTRLGNYLFYNCAKIDTIVFEGSTVTSIGNNAFQNCSGTTFWLDLPSSCTSIGTNAFAGTNFNYVKFYAQSVSFSTNSFTTGYARFLGYHDTGVYDFIKSARASGNDWHYECLDADHDYVSDTVAPTCTEQGYDIYYCQYCDADQSKSNYVDPVGHKYVYASTSNSLMNYNCSYCGQTGLQLDPFAVYNYYKNSISHDNDNAPYHQSNYNGVADLYTDGHINAKDFVILSGVINSINKTKNKTTLNTSTTYQTMEGFGASACWWAQDLGGWDNYDAVMELLYGTENGIGLNVYRYNLAGGTENDTTIGDWHRRGEDFLSLTSDINDAETYDWSADAKAQKVLASAQKYNDNLKLTLFCNTPPVCLTTNGKGYMSDGSTSNLSQSNYQSFANYVINCAEHFKGLGYNVTDVSPVNEPEWEWYSSSGQEGCHWEPAALRTFYNNYMIPTIRNSSLDGIDLTVWDSGEVYKENLWVNYLNALFSSASSYSSSNSNIRNYVDALSSHSYWASTSGRTSAANYLKGSDYSAVKKYRMTEYCQLTGDSNTGVYDLIQQEGTNYGSTIPYGIALADIMYQDITILNAVEWDWWTACTTVYYPDGLIVLHSDTQEYETTKRLWCMGNFSKFIQEGAVRVAVSVSSAPSTLEQCAFQNPDGSMTIVYINKGTSTVFTSVDGYSSLETYVTDETHNLELYQSGDASKLPIAIPASSVTTVVLK